ncbi:hypothetical protein EAY39_07455 [Vibrio anguillarum]|uniref:major coat protein n=1 Tax=Vibrio anguillarum TaxID=55601 RepID=UPI0018C2358B|nr:major coat protein [Vibrio anguillarum]MBF4340627.1 hypothetical protein [Vibrio anguillarum]
MFKNKKSKAALALGLLTVAGIASAAIPSEAQAALDAVKEVGDAVLAWVWVFGTALTVGFVGLKLVRKGANKAS